MRAISLIRVSLEEQTLGYSLAAQSRAIQHYCAQRGWALVEQIEDDAGRSGWTDDLAKRPGLRRALDLIQSGAADVLIVHKLDRLARDKVLAPQYLRMIHRAGGKLVSLTEQWDFTTPQGEFLFGIMANLNEYHSANLAAEVRKGKHERARQGLSNGRPPYGYHCVAQPSRCAERHHWEPCPEQAPKVRWMFERYATGTVSIYDLVAELNAREEGRRWTYGAVRELLRNPVLAGRVRSVAGQFDGQHEAIVAPELFDRVQQVLDGNIRFPKHGPRNRVYVLGGILRCHMCKLTFAGSANVYRYADGRTRVHQFYEERGSYSGRADCTVPRQRFAAYIPEGQVFAILDTMPLPTVEGLRDDILAAISGKDSTNIAGRIAVAEERKRRVNNLYRRGQLSDDEWERELAGVEAELAALAAQMPEDQAAERAVVLIRTLADARRAEEPALLRAVLRELIEAIDYDVLGRQIVTIIPQPPFVPLFRLAAGLEERMDAHGRVFFVPATSGSQDG